MKHKTNIKCVRDIMMFSDYGALSEAFVMEAIRRYAEQCAAADPAEVESPFISGKAWVGVAKEIKAKIEEHFE